MAKKFTDENADYQRDAFSRLHDRQKAEFAMQKDRNEFWNVGALSHKQLGRLIYFEKLLDANLGPFANLARQQARNKYLSGTRTWHHHYVIDIADVTVDLNGRKVHIQIQPSEVFTFEFATTAAPVTTAVVNQLGVDYTVYKGCIVSVEVGVHNGGVKTNARINKFKRSSSGSDVSLIGRVFQTELISEPVSYPQARKAFNRMRYPRALFESFAPGNAHTGVHYRDTQCGENPNTTLAGGVYTLPNPGPTAQHTQRDTAYDVPFANNTANDLLRYAYILGAADWPRASGLQVVTDATYGTREFAILVDASGVFNVFPTAAITALAGVTQNVVDTYVQRKTPTIPAWVFVPSVKFKDFAGTSAESLVDLPEFDWKFNHLGTKAASIVYERSAYTYDTTYWAIDPSGTPFTSTMFNNTRDVLGVTSRIGADALDGAYNPNRYFVAPGIIEVSVSIVLTGPNLEDYTATVSVATVRRPTSGTTGASVYCPVVIGYVWFDIFNVDGTTFAAAGDFVSLDIERYGDGGVAPYKDKITDIWVLRNLVDPTGATFYNTWRGMPLLAADITTLSFVFLVQELKNDRTQNFPVKTGHTPETTWDVRMFDYSFAACIVHSATIKEFLFPITLPTVARNRLVSSFSSLSGYGYLASLPGTWAYSPLANTLDGWTDTNINAVRAGYAYALGYKATPVGMGPTATRDLMFGTWGQELGDDTYLLYCDNPRWGWNCYQSVLCSHMYLNASTTFYAHPSGTYAFWDDAWIYNPQGQADGTNFAQYADTLASFDASLIEHVIFDRVHFEFRSTGAATRGTAITSNTTFLDLYNRAVRGSIASGKLEVGIREMTSADLRAAFVKEVYTYPDPPIAGMQWLLLKATRNGSIWRFTETGVQGGTAYDSALVPKQAGLVGLSFNNERWAPDAGNPSPGEPAYSTSGQHIFMRFADPVVISKLR